MSEPALGAGVRPARPAERALWWKGVAPLVLLAALLAALFRFGPVGVFRRALPPVEQLSIQRVALPRPGEIRVLVVNGGPQPVTIAQVFVDDAAWVHEVEGDRTVGRLEARTIRIPYPWVEGEPHRITVLSRNGLTFTAEVPVATQSPATDARTLGAYGLLGIYAGVLPVYLGLLWLPFLRGVPRRWLDFFLAFTAGLLVFLGVDAFAEALEVSGRVPGAFQGLGLVLLGIMGAPLAITALGEWRARRAGGRSRLYLAGLVAAAIGLHNLGEGLAIGAAYATGEIALGTFLVVGFLVHNSTEGLAVAAPIARERTGAAVLLGLGALAGLPTVLGAWVGGFAYSPVWVALFFALGAGAIAQVVYELGRLFLAREGASFQPLQAAGLLLGLLAMYATGLLVAA